jgi:peptidoglycan/xylan/chitin deacetylase (PgdA/CDA1 family)
MIAITLDDGWHDNYTSVLPVVTAEAIPVTIFVLSGADRMRFAVLAGTNFESDETESSKA